MNVASRLYFQCYVLTSSLWSLLLLLNSLQKKKLQRSLKSECIYLSKEEVSNLKFAGSRVICTNGNWVKVDLELSVVWSTRLIRKSMH